MSSLRGGATSEYATRPPADQRASMNRLLALETSTDACSVALRVGDELFVDHRETPRAHARLLLPSIEALLSRAGIAGSQLDAVVYGRGPGSFTGLRIGCAVAQGLAFAHDLPTLGVSSLEVLAEAARSEHPDCVGVVTLLDARMDEYYGAAWRVHGPAHLEALVDDRVGTPEGITAALRATMDEAAGTWLAVGDVADRIAWSATEARAVRVVPGLRPHATALLALATPRLEDGAERASQIRPVYLRDESRWRRQAPGG